LITLQSFVKRTPFKSKRSSLIFNIGLFLIALGIRIPWLWEVPRYVDELKEVNLAYQIYLGKVYPLHNMAHDIGALHNYILAGIFKILGPGLYWPRLYVVLTSALSVLLIYQLGKRLYNQWTGIIAAGLLLTNGMHILVTHMAWANCTTPFFFLLALLTTVMAKEHKSGGWLMVSGLVWALALQTHSSVIVYLPVIMVYIFTRRFRQDTQIAAKYYVYTGLAFILGYFNMFYYNIISRGGSIAWIFTKGYTLETNPGFISFIRNLRLMFIELMRTICAGYDFEMPFWGYVYQLFFITGIIILGLGTVQTIKTKQGLPLWLVAGGFMIIPWINSRYGYFIVTRYIMPVVICSILLLACGINRLFVLLSSRTAHKQTAVIAFIGLALIFGGFQLGSFYSYCKSLADTDMSNRLALKLVKISGKWAHHSDTEVLIDERIRLRNDPLPVLLALDQQNYVVLRLKPPRKGDPNQTDQLLKAVQKRRKRRMVIITDRNAFQQLKRVASVKKVQSVSHRLVLNRQATSPEVVKIYVIQL
jgi:4-amino-4-deoxy-L-arabinose transferase-like glycosyltransferase